MLLAEPQMFWPLPSMALPQGVFSLHWMKFSEGDISILISRINNDDIPNFGKCPVASQEH